MLMQQHFLTDLKAGHLDLALRRWARAQVRTGTQLRTSVGLIEVVAVDVIASVGADDAVRAGFADAAAATATLAKHGTGEIHRVHLRYVGEDPRIGLRERDDLSDQEIRAIRQKLAGMDARARDGQWTARILGAVADKPQTRAADLAQAISMGKASFKRRVRSLKELGLTESLEVGYRLSPRGVRIFERENR
jgi:hypothetical protein